MYTKMSAVVTTSWYDFHFLPFYFVFSKCLQRLLLFKFKKIKLLQQGVNYHITPLGKELWSQTLFHQSQI